MSDNPEIVAWLKPWCGWSRGVRAVLDKYNLKYDERDVGNDPNMRMEMIQRSGQELSPCVEVNGTMLADVSGDEVEAWLIENKVVSASVSEVDVPTDRGCSDEEHAAQAEQMGKTIRFIGRDE